MASATRREGAALGEVARGAAADRLVDLALVLEGREHQDLGGGAAAEAGDHVEAAHAGELEIEQQHVGWAHQHPRQASSPVPTVPTT